MDQIFGLIAQHFGPEWLLVFWLLWRIERSELRSNERALKDAQLKMKVAAAIRELAAEIRGRD